MIVQRTILAALLAALSCAATACSSDAVACRVGGECASGRCSAEGMCLPAVDGATGAGASTSSGSVGGAGGGFGGGSGTSTGTSTTGGGASGGSGACAPNHDGTITEAESPFAAGLTISYRAALDVTIDTAGSDNGDGTRSWDYSGMLAGDQTLLVETLPLSGLWFESLFPTASYAARLAADSDLLGVFELSSDAVRLLGVVSPADGFGRTELEFDPPVVMLDYPLTVGKTWQSNSTVSGLALGVITAYSESYAFEVDVRGDVTTPFGTFPTLRLRSTLTRTFGLIDTVSRSHSFMTECFGLVASARSQDNETNPEFSNAAELKRIIP